MFSSTEEDVLLAKEIAAVVYVLILIFTYVVLRTVEAKQKLIESCEREAESNETFDTEDPKLEISDGQRSISFGEVKSSVFHLAVPKKQRLGVKANLGMTMKTIATVAFCCHTTFVLPIALVGILASSFIIYLCLWQKELNYTWMTVWSRRHLQATLFCIICLTSANTTLMVWGFKNESRFVKVEQLAGYTLVFYVLGGTSVVLGLILWIWWVVHKSCRRESKPRIDTEDGSTELLE